MAKDAPAETSPQTQGVKEFKAPDKPAKVEPPKGGSYTLAYGHQTPFRRTVTLDGGANRAIKGNEPAKVQLTFNPGEHIELSDTEAVAVKDLIDIGMLVPSDKDEQGRQRQPVRGPASPHSNADAVVAQLEAKCEQQAAELAELRAELKIRTDAEAAAKKK